MPETFSSLLRSPARRTFLSGSITYLTGETLSFGGGQVLSFSQSEGAQGGQLLGGAFSAACSLILRNQDSFFTNARAPYGAQVRLRLCAEDQSVPLACFTVSRVSRREGDPRLILSGSDALGTAFEAPFEDAFSYPLSLGDLARGIASLAGFTLAGDFPNASVSISARPDWGEISLRQALAYAACAAGCFAMISRSGELVFRRVRQSQPAFTLRPAETLQMELGDIAFGPLTGLSILCAGAPRGSAPLTVKSGDDALGPSNSLSISGNPLFAWQAEHLSALTQGLLDALAGLRMTQVRLHWRGDPALCLGDLIEIIGTDGSVTQTVVTRQTLAFSQGFSMQSDCTAQPVQAAVGRIFTSSGALNAAALAGSINGALIQDGSIAARSLMAGSVTALQLAAQSVTTEKLAARAVTADQLGAGAVTADKLNAGAVTADKMAANAVEARHLSAGVFSAMDAHLNSASMDWAQISQLRSVIAAIADAQIASADIDWSRIRDLTADQAIITQGEAGQLYIARLSVTEANLVSLSVGELLLKGADGGFYALSVDSSGQIQTERKQIENADIADESIHGGQKIMEGTVTAAALNARDIFGDSAVIRQLIAANLDVDTLFAREATAARINTLDITGNESIRVYIRRQDELDVYLRVTQTGLEIGRAGDPAKFRADNRTLEVTNLKTERVGIAQSMSGAEEWAWIAAQSGMGLKYIG